MNSWIGLAAGGVIGTFARYLLSGFFLRISGPRFPFGTLAVNLAGCFLIGLFLAIGEQKTVLSHEAKLFLITGFCGAFTTFSTLILETDTLLRAEGAFFALLNILVHGVLGFLIFRAGILAGEMIS